MPHGPSCTPQESLSPRRAAGALSCHQPHPWPTVATASCKNNHPVLRITHQHSPAAVVPTPALAHGQEIRGLVQTQPSASPQVGRALLPQLCCEGISPKCRDSVPSHLTTQCLGMRLLPVPTKQVTQLLLWPHPMHPSSPHPQAALWHPRGWTRLAMTMGCHEQVFSSPSLPLPRILQPYPELGKSSPSSSKCTTAPIQGSPGVITSSFPLPHLCLGCGWCLTAWTGRLTDSQSCCLSPSVQVRYGSVILAGSARYKDRHKQNK